MTFAPHLTDAGKTTKATPFTRHAARSKRTRGEDAAPAPGHDARHVPSDYRTVEGWGADLDPRNRPAVPRELPSEVFTIRGDVRHWQTPRHEIFVSNEHPGLTPVFGESCPPHGLSGLLRGVAYQYGEATSRHWMTLMLADRVERVELMFSRGQRDGAVQDQEPRPKAGLYAAAGVAALAAVGIGLLIRKRAKRSGGG